MADLADFLLARIAEEEATAKAARPWATGSRDEGQPVDWRIHMRNWSPARVLAECAAKRQIEDEHKTIAAAYPNTTIESDPCCDTCSAGGEYQGEFPCRTMRLLALPYAGHPDYHDEWRP